MISKKAQIEGKTEIEIREIMEKQVPANRFAEASEIAYTVTFLASSLANYINGINIPVDGGRTTSL